MQYELKIPKERIAILIGKKGQVKKKLEKLTKTRIKIDSKEGDVTIESEDSLNSYSTQQVIRAIARGFNPEKALELLDEDNCFEILEIGNYTGKSKRKQKRLKGRVIGEEGKAKKMVEQITETYISIYGKTVGIIGKIENVALARKGMIDLLSGAPHGPVFNELQKKKKELKMIELENG